jgi:DNA-binding MarR family transcriptional regulator
MSFNTIVANPGRLSILTALAVEDRQDFVTLRSHTKLTDGNLSCHARRLSAAGMVDIEKKIDEGRPVTRFTLTPAGRQALEAHVRKLLAALSHRRVLPTAPEPEMPIEETAAQAEAVVTVARKRRPAVIEMEAVPSGSTSDDWVD